MQADVIAASYPVVAGLLGFGAAGLAAAIVGMAWSVHTRQIQLAEQLLVRWGVVFRDLVRRENLAVPWREILWAFRRMEARGTIRGGRFVTGFSGEQFAHPDAVDVLRDVRKQRLTGETVQLSAADPLNLTGIILPGPRVPAIHANTVTYTDGATTPAPSGRPLIEQVSEPA